jgi:hypothetical protein
MSSHSGARESRRRFVAALAAAGSALALPAWGFGQSAAVPPSKSKYPSKVVDLVERSLVIDMLAPLKLDFTPAAFSGPFTEADAAMFRSSGITGFHNSIGVGGASAYDDALSSSLRGAASWAATRTCSRWWARRRTPTARNSSAGSQSSRSQSAPWHFFS